MVGNTVGTVVVGAGERLSSLPLSLKIVTRKGRAAYTCVPSCGASSDDSSSSVVGETKEGGSSVSDLSAENSSRAGGEGKVDRQSKYEDDTLDAVSVGDSSGGKDDALSVGWGGGERRKGTGGAAAWRGEFGEQLRRGEGSMRRCSEADLYGSDIRAVTSRQPHCSPILPPGNAYDEFPFSLQQTCVMLTEHYLEPPHIVLAGGGFALHPGLSEPLSDVVHAMDGLLQLAARYHGFHTTRFIGSTELHILTTTTGLHVPATQNQVVLAWVTLMDRIAIAMRELKALCTGNPFDPARRNWPSRIPQAIMWLPEELRRKLPTELLAMHDIHLHSTRAGVRSETSRTPLRFVVDITPSGRSILVPVFPSPRASIKPAAASEPLGRSEPAKRKAGEREIGLSARGVRTETGMRARTVHSSVCSPALISCSPSSVLSSAVVQPEDAPLLTILHPATSAVEHAGLEELGVMASVSDCVPRRAKEAKVSKDGGMQPAKPVARTAVAIDESVEGRARLEHASRSPSIEHAELGMLKDGLKLAESSQSETVIRLTADFPVDASLRTIQPDGLHGYPVVPRADGAVDVCGYPLHRASSAEDRQAPSRLAARQTCPTTLDVEEYEVQELFVSDQRRTDTKDPHSLTCSQGLSVSPSILPPARAPSPSLFLSTPALVFDKGHVESGGLRAMIVQDDAERGERVLTSKVYSISPPDFLAPQPRTPQIVSEEITVESGGLQADSAAVTHQVRSLDGGLIVRDGPREASLPVAFPACGVIDTYLRASSTVQYNISVASEPTGMHNAPVELSAAGLPTPSLVSRGPAAVASLPLVGDDRTAIIGTQRGRVRLLVHRYDAMGCGAGTVELGRLKENSVSNTLSPLFPPGIHFKGDRTRTAEDDALARRATPTSAHTRLALRTGPPLPKSPAPALANAGAVERGGLHEQVVEGVARASRDAPQPRSGAAVVVGEPNKNNNVECSTVEHGGLDGAARLNQQRVRAEWTERRTLKNVAPASADNRSPCHHHPPLSVPALDIFTVVSVIIRTSRLSYFAWILRGNLAKCLAWAREGIGTARPNVDELRRSRTPDCNLGAQLPLRIETSCLRVLRVPTRRFVAEGTSQIELEWRRTPASVVQRPADARGYCEDDKNEKRRQGRAYLVPGLISPLYLRLKHRVRELQWNLKESELRWKDKLSGMVGGFTIPSLGDLTEGWKGGSTRDTGIRSYASGGHFFLSARFHRGCNLKPSSVQGQGAKPNGGLIFGGLNFGYFFSGWVPKISALARPHLPATFVGGIGGRGAQRPRNGVDSERERSGDGEDSEREWRRDEEDSQASRPVWLERDWRLVGMDSQMDLESERRSLGGGMQCAKFFFHLFVSLLLPAIPSLRTSAFLAAQEWGALYGSDVRRSRDLIILTKTTSSNAFHVLVESLRVPDRGTDSTVTALPGFRTRHWATLNLKDYTITIYER
ncbi:hypothetical protein C8R47DRAFT_1079919 [Mycena vitilis]|nr:hypothetical protein C8R47DRAFT_1079919 [Mycena vitilis]